MVKSSNRFDKRLWSSARADRQPLPAEGTATPLALLNAACAEDNSWILETVLSRKILAAVRQGVIQDDDVGAAQGAGRPRAFEASRRPDGLDVRAPAQVPGEEFAKHAIAPGDEDSDGETTQRI
jgi:hypothetical protein